MEARANRCDRDSRQSSRTNPRHGIGVLQLVLALPLLVLTLVAAIQFASVLFVNSSLSAAADEAARLAAMRCSASQIERTVSQHLGIHGIALGPGVRLVVLNDTGITQAFGDPALNSSSLDALPPAGMVRAILLVSTDVTPIPNALASYCVDYSGRQYELCATAFMQLPALGVR